MKCTVCSHPERQGIDQALLAGHATYAALGQQYGLSISALFRHKKLLTLKMARVEKDLATSLRQDSLFRFNEFLETTRQISRTAAADGDTRQALRAVREGTRILNFITKLDVQLDQDTVYRVLASPQWTTQDSLLPTDPEITTGAHQALADNLFYPCLELPAALEDAIAQEATSETAPGTGIQKPETLPKIQRETSAKLPRKTRLSKNNNEQYHKHISCKKNAAKIPGVGRESEAHPAVKQSTSQPLEPQSQTNEARQTVSAPATGNRKPETVVAPLPPGFTRELLQQILTRLDQPITQTPAANPPLETGNSELDPPPPESLFQRLRRKWAKTAVAPQYSCNSEEIYAECLSEKTPPASETRTSCSVKILELQFQVTNLR